ncbi:24786_t:CDS:2 [Cetraspora pellucida]|uniref:24786_t:CDS:1 n=1 Tax=Cetraspora pellucida TaxID=1433469 RepID=A0A9N9IPW6_9GLOM|nr:24786_t:CDS:2 [Cetraspora pellucida]
MADLISITNSKDYDEIIKIEDSVKPLWVLLVDGGPDENPRYLKNITEYSGIVLSIDHFGTYLNSQGQVINEELAIKNFQFSGEKLRDLWQCDKIHDKPIKVTYLDNHTDMLTNDDISWQWIEYYCQICCYSLDIRKCINRNCCKPPWAPEATILLQENNGFLPPMIQGHD